MNKEHFNLSEYERFNLFLSMPAVDRELTKIKKPVVNVEPLPTPTLEKKPSTHRASYSQKDKPPSLKKEKSGHHKSED